MDTNNDFFKNRAIIILTSVTLLTLTIFIATQIFATLHTVFNPTTAPVNTITVSGKGTATSTPNVVSVSYGVSAIASSVVLAQEKATKIGNAALAFLAKKNISNTNIKSTSYVISPNYENGACRTGFECKSRKPNGYQVSQKVTVKVTDIKEAGVLVRGLGQVGATSLYVGSPQTADSVIYENLARTHAIEQARKNAVVLAGELGVHLGRLVRFSQFGGRPVPLLVRSFSLTSKANTPAIPAGENTYTSNVSLVYSIY